MAIDRKKHPGTPGEAERDPVLHALMNAPIDDEPVTPDEEDDLAEAYDDLQAGRLLSTAELRRRLGLPEKS
jgi:hypothetical protein